MLANIVLAPTPALGVLNRCTGVNSKVLLGTLKDVVERLETIRPSSENPIQTRTNSSTFSFW